MDVLLTISELYVVFMLAQSETILLYAHRGLFAAHFSLESLTAFASCCIGFYWRLAVDGTSQFEDKVAATCAGGAWTSSFLWFTHNVLTPSRSFIANYIKFYSIVLYYSTLQ